MFKVIIYGPNHNLLEKLSLTAFSEFNCQGLLENQLEEIAVDSILAEDSFCGGDVPEHVLKKLNDVPSPNPAYYFESHCQALQFSKWVEQISQLKCTIEKEPEKDWNEEWRKHYRPILLGEDFWIVPSWQVPPDNCQHIRINPGQGFGTGSHPTTCGCLEALLQFQTILKSQTNTILDFGCGSGILGIASAKIINGNIDFCDIDENALDNCLENIQLNNLNINSYSLISRKSFKYRPYNIIFANILLNVLIEESKTIQSCLRPDGLLFLSGILDDQIDELCHYYQDLFPFKEELRLIREKWVTLVLRRL